ncbi:IclR family transcriptional regulator C-terminal domain-containing protein [Achromobacter sp. Marseille-Q4962]|uniref:IclR family transcriptional regulator n=1 Tax=Achromobacter sp. Marseille-Q4962 TaxID=2942202 RepID=UPI0020739F27|nr:IclR family transcriptional regulator C-terminal domain-containing protein [Achromobacter sp. Marseille-Q4962]
MQDSDAAAAGPRTLRRGLAVLAALRDQGTDGLSVTDIARLTGIQRPTIYRLLAALLDAGLVLPVAGTKKYRAQLAVDPDTRSRDPRVRQLLPVLRRLADRTGDAVFLVVRDEDDSISLHREIGSYPVQILATYAGKRQPLGVGSGGMALLAALPDEVARGIVERNSGRLDEYGGMTPQEMYRLIENTRARGYSVVGNHAVRGALGVGCALLDAHGAPLLAVSVTAIIDRMPAQRQREIAGWIKAELARLAVQA